ncbi:MFS transporter [Anabaena cylindrica FACHB-243]|uniref:Major facilitator superfamily MFS_1 n=1 Tax=Anabaena cylindrica (strain ATCC 27899 / PCC 7122) TaxID=272123 RepID=K9ZQR3_ANACC|nr:MULTISPECIES: MFS transporter [Anabaena]AFZ61124.1 major facilitator superfamily MFS_1 [Anabaena cylindrica PCC 7122]MBD2421599.1 MFS transporter [Anabaena cylindrica FACHB-243]MBY5280502.1 MFS transporter [Anabaena sp. CCAP 1446/1C]MBY5308233.1 MFS transporter [Anabaena sp. CCAP 1446/1C]MCM2405500.1 MFS transporter [Anabaena sp. CCAP 1446/1C]
MNTLTFFRSLRNPVFARLYTAQTTSLLGDALTWVGLALLAFELAGKNAAVVLSVALTLRVTAFVLLSPLAGAIADRLDRKKIMVVTHIFRMLIVGMLPFVTQIWQVYVLIFALNVFNAFFTPTYQATIPLVTGENDYPQAIALSAATFQLLGVLGPGIAGSVAAFIGARQVFFLDALSFAIAAVLIFTLPGQLVIAQNQQPSRTTHRTWGDIKDGTTRLLIDAPIRYALAMQLVASIAGAQILVNTVGYVQGTLNLGEVQYGWVMAAFGIGATLCAVIYGTFNRSLPRTTFVFIGATLITLALLPVNYANLAPLMLLWFVAGAGQSLVNLPTQTLIADRIPAGVQGRVYGAHFAWSHLWWAISYPLAGWLGSNFAEREFLYGSLVGLMLLVVVQVTLSPQLHEHEHLHYLSEHEHKHIHDEHHQHEHNQGMAVGEPHNHRHEHTVIINHSHPHTRDIHHRHSH